MPQKSNREPSLDPMAAWRQWYENAASVWTNTLDGNQEAYLDPFGLYRQWLKSAEERGDGAAKVAQGVDPAAQWKDWFDATTAMWQRAANAGVADPMGLTKQWLETLDRTRARMFAAEQPSLDPLSFFREWYETTSQMWSGVVGDVIGNEAFVEAASRMFDIYVSSYDALRKASETQLRNMRMPTQADVARVAGLVVALEAKVDQLADTLEAAQDEHAHQATAADVHALEHRIERIEARLDTLLAAVERLGTGAPAAPTERANGRPAARRTTSTRTRRTASGAGGRAAG